MNGYHHAVFLIAALTAACGERSAPFDSLETFDEARLDTRKGEAPIYGRIRRIEGIVSTGFETHTIDVCQRSLETCLEEHLLHPERECNLRYAEAAWREAERARNSLKMDEGDLHFIQGNGRLATNGWFGHLDMSACQVEILQVDAVRKVSHDPGGIGLKLQ